MFFHLTDDVGLVNGAYELFERYYPEQNIFIVQVSRNAQKSTQVLPRANVYFIPFTTKAGIRKIDSIAQQHSVKCVLVHYLTPSKAAVALRLTRIFKVKLYWIFFGADLYGWLHNHNKYQLLDDSHSPSINIKSIVSNLTKKLHFFLLYKEMPDKAYERFIAGLHYFCFWNNYDYDLLLKHFTTKASFRYFLYFGLIDLRHLEIKPKESQRIMVNHSASLNGNHLTVLKSLKEINLIGDFEILTPLSYGDKGVRKEVVEFGRHTFDKKFTPLLQRMPMNEYYNLLSQMTVAIFGNRRQEGAGNVFFLLKAGVKVFLRNDNNMIQWLRSNGFIIFSFEDDLMDKEQLEPLTANQALINLTAYEKLFSPFREKLVMEKLLN
jgi:dTDP-N-acetylfucosamine:lipid II N-acetylfucosaminyltransferase